MFKYFLSVILSVIFLNLNVNLKGQNIIGQWQEHFSFEKGILLDAGQEALFCLSETGLISYSKSGDVNTFSKLKGLSDVDIQTIKWNKNHNLLFIAYKNGNIDLLTKNKIFNISDIKDFNVYSEQTINDISFKGKFAYLACNFGLVVVDIDKKEITNTYYIGDNGQKENILSVCVTDDNIYAGSEYFLKKINLDKDNISDFRNWQTLSITPNKYTKIIKTNTDLLFVIEKKDGKSQILKSENLLPFIDNLDNLSSVKYTDTRLYIVSNGILQVYDNNGMLKFSVEEYYIDDKRYESEFSDVIKWNSNLYCAAKNHSLLNITDPNNASYIKVNGPLSGEILNMVSADANIFTLLTESGYTYIDKYKNSLWQNGVEKIFKLSEQEKILSISADKANDRKVYVSTSNNKILEFIGDNVSQIDIPSQFAGLKANLIDTEDGGNLWLVDSEANNTIYVRTYKSEWSKVVYRDLENISLSKFLCLSNGDKWALSENGDFIFAFNNNNTLNNVDDDYTKMFSVKDKDSNVLSGKIYDFIEDKDANIWLASDKGVIVYFQAGNIFREGDFYASRPIITIDGDSHYLLSTETITSICVDGANRKWLGTQNAGLFLVSENGDKQLEHFNTSNSPLPSNSIKRVAINNHTGELLIQTSNGLVSYKTGTTKGSDDFNDLYVYPNPVRENYHADIIVSGLIDGASVKITNINAKLIAQGVAEGGQFVWNGKNRNNNRVSTGVYLIFCANADGSKSKIIKLLFIN